MHKGYFMRLKNIFSLENEFPNDELCNTIDLWNWAN